MNSSWRIGIFAAGALGMAVLFGLACSKLPGAEGFHSPYGEAIVARTVSQRQVTDAVTAVNFDFRGFDTLGEEFILFTSVMGAMVLLREVDEEKETGNVDAARRTRAEPPSDAVRAWTLAMTGPTVLYGLYIVAHGQTTPGGGFQGGVILATAPLLIYLVENFDVFTRVTSHWLIEVSEAVGAGGYAIIGTLGWIAGREFLTNVLPAGQARSLTSGGTVMLINWATGLEVTAAFVLLLYAFLQKTLDEKGGQA